MRSGRHFRLSGIKLKRGNLLLTKPAQRLIGNAKKRLPLPKIKIRDGKVIITTRKQMSPLAKRLTPMLDSTKPF